MLNPDRLIRKHVRSSYFVTLASEEVFTGILTDADANHLVLENAQQIAATGDRVTVDGQLWLPRSSIKYMQLTTDH